MRVSVAVIAMLSIAADAMADSTFSVTGGVDYSRGAYGSSTTTSVLYIPLTAKYELGDVTLKLTVPHIRQTGSGDVVRGVGKTKRVVTQQVVTTEVGMGDVVASADYTFFDEDDLILDILESIKFGTANSNKGLGTGKNDYSTEFDGNYGIGVSSVYWTVGYTVVGVPAAYQLRNVSYGSIGGSRRIGDDTTVGLTLDVSESSSQLSENPRELTVDVSVKLSPVTKVTANLMKGFSNGSPDFGGGLKLKALF